MSNLSLEALENHLKTSQSLLRELKFAHAISPIKNSMRIRNQRRLVARLKTAARMKRT